jgi:hypothetical protein
MAKLALSLSFSFSSLYHSKQKLFVMRDSFRALNNEKIYLSINVEKSYIADDTTLSKKVF